MPIDHKFKIRADRISDGKEFTEEDCFIFQADEQALPRLLYLYVNELKYRKADPELVKQADALHTRVILYQEKHRNEITVTAPDKDHEEK